MVVVVGARVAVTRVDQLSTTPEDERKSLVLETFMGVDQRTGDRLRSGNMGPPKDTRL